MLESTEGSTGALIGIIVGVVCCLGLTAGGVWYFCKHKKGDSGNMYNNDDLYEAFVDTETAWVSNDHHDGGKFQDTI